MPNRKHLERLARESIVEVIPRSSHENAAHTWEVVLAGRKRAQRRRAHDERERRFELPHE